MNKKYTEIRKVSYDKLWHAEYKRKNLVTGEWDDVYDQLTESEAILIAKSL